MDEQDKDRHIHGWVSGCCEGKYDTGRVYSRGLQSTDTLFRSHRPSQEFCHLTLNNLRTTMFVRA